MLWQLYKSTFKNEHDQSPKPLLRRFSNTSVEKNRLGCSLESDYWAQRIALIQTQVTLV